MIDPVAFKQMAAFYGPWAVSLFAAAAGEPQIMAGQNSGLTIEVESLAIPVLQAGLAMAGVLLARPLAPRREMRVGPARFAVVTAIMLIVAVIWVAQSRPGPLLAFVVSIGLGFSGYSLIEFAGREIESMIKRLIGVATRGSSQDDTNGTNSSKTGNDQ